MSTKEQGYWFCHNCKEEVDSGRVTYQELHEDCGHPPEWITPVTRSDGWISVEDALPDDSGEYGDCKVQFKLKNGDVLTGIYWDNDWQWELKNKPWFGSRNVTHWQTIEPPKEEVL